MFKTKDVTVYLAAAGCGKTEALITEMSKALEIYRPDEIAFVTYTRKGVQTGIERALKVNTHLSSGDFPYYATLHALCFRALGLKKENLMSDKMIKAFNEKYEYKLTRNKTYENQSEDDKMLSRYDLFRNNKARYERELASQENIAGYRFFVSSYEKFKKANKVVDFHDCLTHYLAKGDALPVKAAFIDEAQDLSPLQWNVCEKAFENCEKIFVAGDDYQSVFTYAGAAPYYLIKLSKECKTIKLEKSRRLPKAVYEFAKRITYLIDKEEKIDKDYKPVDGREGSVKELFCAEELISCIKKDLKTFGITSGRWYLLFRANCFIADVKTLLEAAVIPYHTSAGFCLDVRSLDRIKRFLDYRKAGKDTAGLKTFCLKYNIKSLDDDFIETDLIKGGKKYLYRDYVEEYGIEKLKQTAVDEPYMVLSTIHKVKGGEADNVALFLDSTAKIGDGHGLNNEELRVLYVGCTRAKENLFIIDSSKRYNLGSLIKAAKVCPKE